MVAADSLAITPLGEEIATRHRRRGPIDISGAGVARGLLDRWMARSQHELESELHQEQLEVAGPPVLTFEQQLAAIRQGRALADAAAREHGARVVALGSSLWPDAPRLTHGDRAREVGADYGLLAAEQLSCGMHVHVEVDSRQEGVQVLDRIRPWLHVLLALSANSPFWFGRDSEFASYRHLSWSRWPTAGPSDVLGSVLAYDCRTRAMLRAGAAIDTGMLYFDARLSDHCPTVEVRIADVCLDAQHAAAVAALTRALVTAAARQWSMGESPSQASTAQLRAWSWHAARHGLAETLGTPHGGAQLPAPEVVAQLLDFVTPELEEAGEADHVATAVARIVDGGTGSSTQRATFARRGSLHDVAAAAVRLTHGEQPPDTPTSLGRLTA
ncbi:glutamate--cysteine ligase [Tessaracoccus terricola]